MPAVEALHLRVPFAFLALALALATLSPPAVAVGDVVVATGVVRYEYENAAPTAGVVFASCAGEGVATVTFEPTTRRFLVTFEVPGCTPVFSLFLFCRGGDGEAVECHRAGDGFAIDVTLDVDGTLSYSYVDATFTEIASGALVRL